MRHHPTTPPPPLGRLHDAGGRDLWLHRSGEGGPAVVFLPGAGVVGLDFLNVHERVAEFTTSVLYDRAGTGWSDAAELPRSAADVTDELRALLRAADVPGPYLLVGHSLAGVYARHYAQRFPGEVAALLLLDPYHEDNTTRMPRQALQMQEQMRDQPVPEPSEEVIEMFRTLFAQKLAHWPQSVREPLIEHHLAHWRTGMREMENLDEVGNELRHAADVPDAPDVPLIVLSASGHDPARAAQVPEDLERAINEVKLALHAELADAAPDGLHRVLDDAGHNWMHVDRPDAVLRAIHDLLERP
ncbi:alpha/beta hydrolase [Streptomyces decoyicus]|uniref:alpha/beta fold hydrolase n=1 Tax=Streptomyces decoyicus TaxID=249567 RepID=UPI00345CBA20